MRYPLRRLIAAVIDALCALLLAAIVITWLPRNEARQFGPFIWALCLVLFPLVLRGETPGKNLTGLKVTGVGCLPCREIRRWGFALLWGLSAVLLPLAPEWVPPLVFLSGTLVLVRTYFWTRGGDARHNSTTGFIVGLGPSGPRSVR